MKGSMKLVSIFALVLCFLLPIYSMPTNTTTLQKRCGPIEIYYHGTSGEWTQYGIDSWLDKWWNDHPPWIQAREFAAAFGEEALGNPDWTCLDDGSSYSCDFDTCNQHILSRKDGEERQYYWVLESIKHLHITFMGTSEASQQSAITTAFGFPQWTDQFYNDKDTKAYDTLKGIFASLQTVVGLGFSRIAPEVSVMFNGAMAITQLTLPNQ